MLNSSPQCESTTLDLVISSLSLNIGGWENVFLVDVWITSFSFQEKSSSLVVPGADPPPTCASFLLGVLCEDLFVGFLRGIFPI
jgi:hypothetical protein